MPDKFRVASFNVENLFTRPKVFNFQDKSVGDTILERIGDFRKILKKTTYSAADKASLVKAFTQDPDSSDPEKKPLRDFILIREDRGKKLWKTSNRQITDVKANGADELDLTIEFKKARYSQVARGNTGKVIRSVKADIACIVEADSRETLKRFDADVLRYKYRYEMLIDGNDRRGIDVGLYSRYPIGGIWTHMFDGSSSSRTFSRDCPEYEIFLPNGQPLYLLCNHLKSKGYDFNGNASNRRKRQAQAIADILAGYDLANDWVVVAGDLNDTPDSTPLKPLMDVDNLFDVLQLQFGSDTSKRWTYHYNSFEQIDYVLVSRPMKEAFVEAGVQRKGIYNLDRLTGNDASIPDETQYSSVTSWTNQASDHGAVWADFEL